MEKKMLDGSFKGTNREFFACMATVIIIALLISLSLVIALFWRDIAPKKETFFAYVSFFK